MAKITLKIDSKKLRQIKAKLKQLEDNLVSIDGQVFRYMLTIAEGYKEAVISGMGQTSSGTMALKSFLGETKNTAWEPLAKVTTKLKAKNGWRLEIWMATGKTKEAVKVYSRKSGRTLEVSAGIPEGSFEYDKALKVEFGAYSDPGGNWYNRRALFTLLNVILTQHSDQIREAIRIQIKKSIAEVGWGN